MSEPVKLCLFGEEAGWALQTGKGLTSATIAELGDAVRLCPLAEADVVYSLWEVFLLDLPREQLAGKRVLCNITNDFCRLHEQACMIDRDRVVGRWVAQSDEAERMLQELNMPFFRLAYSVDTTTFRAELPAGATRETLRAKYGLPADHFVVSNFMRDTLGADLARPKDQKAAEAFLELIAAVATPERRVHVLLAGPRRHWLRARFRDRGIPFTFAGEEIDGDDMPRNVLDAATLNELYHASDLHLIASRWEGGPRPALEAVATRTPILCTPVGAAADLLEPQNLFRDFAEGVGKLRAAIDDRALEATRDTQLERLQRNHTPAANVEPFRRLLSRIEEVDPTRGSSAPPRPLATPSGPVRRFATRASNAIKALRGPGHGLKIGMWYEFHKPPWGGGNQFMTALRAGMRSLGATVVVNSASPSVDVHLASAAWFDAERLAHYARERPLRLIHRIDGPIALYRGEGPEEDDRVHELNKAYATATVYQSGYCLRQHCQLGYEAVRPIIIHNAVNGTIFHPGGRTPRPPGRKLRLITTSWSDNPRKGGALLKWLDTRLDWSRFEYTFVGRVNETFDNIRHVPAVSSTKLAAILRDHDIFISASLNEPCSNALLEGMACGCAALYRQTGGNAELVGFGGLSFDDENDILERLDQLAERVDAYRGMIHLASLQDVAKRYLDLALRVANEDPP